MSHVVVYSESLTEKAWGATPFCDCTFRLPAYIWKSLLKHLMVLLCFCFFVFFVRSFTMSELHWLHSAHNNRLSNLQSRCILNAAASFSWFCEHFCFLFSTFDAEIFWIEQTNYLFNYSLTNEPVNVFGLFFVNILFSVVCFSLGVWSAIFQILSSIFLKFMKCYLLLLYSTQKPYCYLMVRFLTMLDMGTWMRPNSVFLLAVVGFAAS